MARNLFNECVQNQAVLVSVLEIFVYQKQNRLFKRPHSRVRQMSLLVIIAHPILFVKFFCDICRKRKGLPEQSLLCLFRKNRQRFNCLDSILQESSCVCVIAHSVIAAVCVESLLCVESNGTCKSLIEIYNVNKGNCTVKVNVSAQYCICCIAAG